MGRIGRYDSEIQMFVEEAREPDLRHLMFLRWLVQNERSEHLPAGFPCGPFVDLLLPDGQAGKVAPLAS